MINNNPERCINLKRKIILWNSKGKRNPSSNLLCPNDSGKSIYWWKKDFKGISPIKINNKNNDNIKIVPKIPDKIFLKSKLKIK